MRPKLALENHAATMVAMYDSGQSMCEIAKRYAISYGTARRVLLENGVTPSPGKHISAKLKGRPGNRRGVQISDETRERMKIAAKLRGSHFGYRFTDQQRANMSAARKRYFANTPPEMRRSKPRAIRNTIAHESKETPRIRKNALAPEEAKLRLRLRSKMKSWVRRILTMPRIREHKRYERILGYTQRQLRKHLETQFIEGMAWGMRESFHIDHAVPVSEFLRRGICEPKIINALANLRVLTPMANRLKSDRYDPACFADDYARLMQSCES